MINALKACYDSRVIAALAAVGIGVFVFAPSLITAALPLLLLAACPLSMVVMMKMMGGHDSSPGPQAAANPVDRGAQLEAQLAASRREQQRLATELEQLGAERTAPASAKSSAPGA